jgi:hypothetical protein
MLTALIIAFVSIEPWMQFGLAGVTFITLATLLVMMMKKMGSRDKNSVDIGVMMKVREETLLEINKRDAQILELSSKVLDGLHTSSRALERMSERMDDLEAVVEEMKNIVARCPNVRE